MGGRGRWWLVLFGLFGCDAPVDEGSTSAVMSTADAPQTSGAGTSAPTPGSDAGSGADPSGGSTSTEPPGGGSTSGVDPETSGADPSGADTSAGDDGSTGSPAVDTCEDLAAMAEFDNNPPAGETRVAGLGDCVTVLDGETLWNYHCVWCHSTLDDNDIQDRSLDRVWWAVDLSEGLGNWPEGGLANYPGAVERIQQVLLASPEATVDAHPHPLPEYE